MFWRQMWNGFDAMRLGWKRILPASLAGRTALMLMIALTLVQGLGLFIHTLDRIDLQQLAQARAVGIRIGGIYRTIVLTAPDARHAMLNEGSDDPAVKASLDSGPLLDALAPPEVPFDHAIHEAMRAVSVPPSLRPREVLMRGDHRHRQVHVAMQLPDGEWLNMSIGLSVNRLWLSPSFLVAFLLMTLTASVLILWAVRRLIAPMRTLADAADMLGRDVNAPALPETGPTEIAMAARAFNQMAERLRRFVRDRTVLLAAIGHDLRTPITRLKLRAEFIDDDEMRSRFLADLDELETMVSATLAFGRDAAGGEPLVPMDLPALLRTILDETADAWPDIVDALTYEGPERLTLHARPVALKRALSNLVFNAARYAHQACVTLTTGNDVAIITIEDNGTGIPPEELDRVFEPFYRVERSRNRETGGSGLGLPIARNILRAHGGDVVLANRGEGGLRAMITLPL